MASKIEENFEAKHKFVSETLYPYYIPVGITSYGFIFLSAFVNKCRVARKFFPTALKRNFLLALNFEKKSAPKIALKVVLVH